MQEQSRKTVENFEIRKGSERVTFDPVESNPMNTKGFVDAIRDVIEEHNDLSEFGEEEVVAGGSVDIVSYSDIENLESDVRYEARVDYVDDRIDVSGWSDE